jgi:hypothetical protein
MKDFQFFSRGTGYLFASTSSVNSIDLLLWPGLPGALHFTVLANLFCLWGQRDSCIRPQVDSTFS